MPITLSTENLYTLKQLLLDWEALPLGTPLVVTSVESEAYQLLCGTVLGPTFSAPAPYLATWMLDGSSPMFLEIDTLEALEARIGPTVEAGYTPINFIALDSSCVMTLESLHQGYPDRPLAFDSGALIFYNEITPVTKESLQRVKLVWDPIQLAFIPNETGFSALAIKA